MKMNVRAVVIPSLDENRYLPIVINVSKSKESKIEFLVSEKMLLDIKALKKLFMRLYFNPLFRQFLENSEEIIFNTSDTVNKLYRMRSKGIDKLLDFIKENKKKIRWLGKIEKLYSYLLKEESEKRYEKYHSRFKIWEKKRKVIDEKTVNEIWELYRDKIIF